MVVIRVLSCAPFTAGTLLSGMGRIYQVCFAQKCFWIALPAICWKAILILWFMWPSITRAVPIWCLPQKAQQCNWFLCLQFPGPAASLTSLPHKEAFRIQSWIVSLCRSLSAFSPFKIKSRFQPEISPLPVWLALFVMTFSILTLNTLLDPKATSPFTVPGLPWELSFPVRVWGMCLFSFLVQLDT